MIVQAPGVQAGSAPDVIAVDGEGNPIVAVEVTGRPSPPESVSQTLSFLQAAAGTIGYAMLVDPRVIRLYGRGRTDPMLTLDTEAVLSHYDQEFGSKQIFEHYLISLVEAWLRDLAYHWKSESPPGSESLAKLGLLENLKGGTTVAERLRRADPLP